MGREAGLRQKPAEKRHLSADTVEPAEKAHSCPSFWLTETSANYLLHYLWLTLFLGLWPGGRLGSLMYICSWHRPEDTLHCGVHASSDSSWASGLDSWMCLQANSCPASWPFQVPISLILLVFSLTPPPPAQLHHPLQTDTCKCRQWHWTHAREAASAPLCPGTGSSTGHPVLLPSRLLFP